MIDRARPRTPRHILLGDRSCLVRVTILLPVALVVRLHRCHLLSSRRALLACACVRSEVCLTGGTFSPRVADVPRTSHKSRTAEWRVEGVQRLFVCLRMCEWVLFAYIYYILYIYMLIILVYLYVIVHRVHHCAVCVCDRVLSFTMSLSPLSLSPPLSSLCIFKYAQIFKAIYMLL